MNHARKISRFALLAVAVAAGVLPFAAPAACRSAVAEGLALCSGPLLVSLFPFLIVSALLVQSPAGAWLSLPLRPIARLIGVRAEGAARVLLIGLLGGFAPAANAAAEAVRAHQLTPREADDLLPACVCAAPSFVVLTVGEELLGSAALGLRLYLAQTAAGILTAALLCRLGRQNAQPQPDSAAQKGTSAPARLDVIISNAAVTYIKLCGFVIFFRMLAAGAGQLLPPALAVVCAALLELCSGCDLASRLGPWASFACCAAISVQGLSVLMQVRTICPPEMTLRPLYAARFVHLPLSLSIFWLLLPTGEQDVFSTLCERVVIMRRVPLDCALIVFFACCCVTNEAARALGVYRAGATERKWHF